MRKRDECLRWRFNNIRLRILKHQLPFQHVLPKTTSFRSVFLVCMIRFHKEINEKRKPQNWNKTRHPQANSTQIFLAWNIRWDYSFWRAVQHDQSQHQCRELFTFFSFIEIDQLHSPDSGTQSVWLVCGRVFKGISCLKISSTKWPCSLIFGFEMRHFPTFFIHSLQKKCRMAARLLSSCCSTLRTTVYNNFLILLREIMLLIIFYPSRKSAWNEPSHF